MIQKTALDKASEKWQNLSGGFLLVFITSGLYFHVNTKFSNLIKIYVIIVMKNLLSIR